MSAHLTALLRWWRTRHPATRQASIAALAILGLLTLGVTWRWLTDERRRLRDAVPLANAHFRQMQDGIAEYNRLRSQAMPAHLTGQALADAIAATLRGRGLSLTVTMPGTDQLRVEGTADFDEVVTWLGAIQRDYMVRVVSLVATRQASSVKLAVVLASAAS